MIAILTGHTCGEACWHAREETCRCSCGGANHGCLVVPGGERPARTRRIGVYRYELISTGSRKDLWPEFRELIRAAPPRLVCGRLHPWSEYSNEKGMPFFLQAASAAQMDKWPELQSYRELDRTQRYQLCPCLLWKRIA